jgi:hypothetical protein
MTTLTADNLKRRFVWTSAPATLLLAATLCLGATAPSTPAPNFNKDFDTLVTKNIFSKNRIRNRPDINNGRGPNWRPPRPPKVYTPVLIGVMLEDDGYVAFIVDPKSREITTVRPGDELPSGAGTLKDVTLDYIITDPGNGKPSKRVLIGQNILGGVPEYPDSSDDSIADNSETSGPSTQPGAASASPASPAQSGATPSGGNVDDIAERLRKRRQQQLGK